jgi:hypothetical protein
LPKRKQSCQIRRCRLPKELITEVQKINNSKEKQKPILLKIAPDLNLGQLDEIIALVAETKIDGVIVSNTSVNRDGLRTSKEILEKMEMAVERKTNQRTQHCNDKISFRKKRKSLPNYWCWRNSLCRRCFRKTEWERV